jgi:hypothetical protein
MVMTDEERELDEEEEELDEEVEPIRPAYGAEARATGSVFIETGRGQAAEVQAGSPFRGAIERIADEAHYGGYFRVFLNGEEVVNPEESPATIEPGMRVAITSYDKVG